MNPRTVRNVNPPLADTTRAATAPQSAAVPRRWWLTLRQDAPSLAFLGVVAANTAAIAWASNPWLLCALCAAQALLLIGCQEAKHQCVHRTFLTHRGSNDAVGMVCAALFLVNFHAYRHFHFAHHRDTATERDPEGHLYSRSLSARWIWLLAPLEIGWTAYHLNRKAWSSTPRSNRFLRNAGAVFACAFAGLFAALAVWKPTAFLLAFALPLALCSWIDFLLTQAEHYGVPVAPASQQKRPPGETTQDVIVPRWMSWMMLHRPLHRVHHMHPALRWFEAPGFVGEDGGVPVTYLAFVARWLREGPRLWLREDGSRV
jgi:fatty acid desaturase